MSTSSEKSITPSVDTMSQKVQSLMTNTGSTQSEMMLPKNRFEPFFLKVLNQFAQHHKIPENINPPQGSVMPHKLFSYILDLMAHSMGDETRKTILSELEEYKRGLPFDLR